MKSSSLLRAAAAIVVLLTASQAVAHARLVSASPADKATVEKPQEVVLHFSENLVATFSGFTLTKTDGAAVPLATAVSKSDPKTVMGKLQAVLSPGSYKITWRAVAADDGHRTTGDLTFTVR